MQTDATIMFVDVQGTTALEGYDVGQLLDLTHEMVELLAADAQHFSAWGDLALAIFEHPPQAYEALRQLAVWWRDYPLQVEALPAEVGLRGALHVGSVTIAQREGALIGPDVNLAARLSVQSPLDAIFLTPEALNALSATLKGNGVVAERRVAYLPGGESMLAYELRFASLVSEGHHDIHFAPPADLLLFLAAQPQELFNVAPRRFEEIMAELLADLGYTVELTKTTRDDGIDIIAIGRSGFGSDERYLVQCKRNAPHNRVGVGVVRDLLGVGVHEPNTGLLIATTSTFTKPATRLALKETVRWRLHLRDYDDILLWLRAYAQRRL